MESKLYYDNGKVFTVETQLKTNYHKDNELQENLFFFLYRRGSINCHATINYLNIYETAFKLFTIKSWRFQSWRYC